MKVTSRSVNTIDLKFENCKQFDRQVILSERESIFFD